MHTYTITPPTPVHGSMAYFRSSDPLVELHDRVERRRTQAQAAVQTRRMGLAGKQQELAVRAARMRDRAFAIAKPEIIDEVKRRLLTAREQVGGGE